MISLVILAFLIPKITSQENASATENITMTYATTNVTKIDIEEQVTEPSTQSLHLPRTIMPIPNISKPGDKLNMGEFRPSPEVKEVHYEQNLFPVRKVMGEAKNNNDWKFPQNPITSKDRPYQFMDNSRNYHGITGKNDFETNINKPLTYGSVSKIPISSSGSGSGIGTSGVGEGNSWDAIPGGYHEPKLHSLTGLKHKPYAYHEKGTSGLGGYGHDLSEKHYNPWKKIIKILAAFIPIGLLISALTPTIITVTPMNGTLLRSRADDSSVKKIKNLVSSINSFESYDNTNCENKILCELLLSATSSQNAEQHIENFLNVYSNGEKITGQRAEELRLIFEGVKQQNCGTIPCKNLKEYT